MAESKTPALAPLQPRACDAVCSPRMIASVCLLYSNTTLLPPARGWIRGWSTAGMDRIHRLIAVGETRRLSSTFAATLAG